MVGQPSGFIETLPKAVRDRIEYLRTLQEKHDDLEDKYNEELRALEAKYEALYGALRATLPAHMTAPASACAPAHSQRAQTGQQTCVHDCRNLQTWLQGWPLQACAVCKVALHPSAFVPLRPPHPLRPHRCGCASRPAVRQVHSERVRMR